MLVLHAEGRHQRTRSHRVLHVLLLRLVVGPQQVAKMIGVGGLRAYEALARDGDVLHAVADLLHDSLLAGHARHGVAIALAEVDVLADDTLRDQGAHAVVDEHDVVVLAACVAQSLESVADGVLIAVASLEDPLQFGDVELVGVGLQHHLPALEADHREGVDLRMLLEGPHRIDDDGDIVYGHELLGNVLSHAVADTAGCQ